MTIRHLKIFITVVETGKMSLAAERLFLSQPTVSQAVRELEEHYHILLFERLSKKLFITEAGKQLLSYARQAVEQFDLVEERMLEEDGKQRLRLGVTLTVGSCLLTDLLRRMEEECPLTDLYAYVGNTRMIEERLLGAELDIAIVEGRVKRRELVSIPMVSDVLVLACAASHPMAGKREITPEMLTAQTFVMREPGSGTRALFEAYMERKGLAVQSAIETDSIDIIKNAILKTGYMAVVSERLLEHEIKMGLVYAFYSKARAWGRSFHLVYHKDKYKTTAMEILEKMLPDYERKEQKTERKYGEILDA